MVRKSSFVWKVGLAVGGWKLLVMSRIPSGVSAVFKRTRWASSWGVGKDGGGTSSSSKSVQVVSVEQKQQDAEEVKPLIWGRLSGSLSEIQRGKMVEMIEWMRLVINDKDNDPMIRDALEREGGCERLVLRILRARDFNVGAAKKMFVDVINWRQKEKSWEYGVEFLKVEKACWHFRDTGGVDRKGRPLLYAKASFLKTRLVDKTAFYHACIAQCEHVLRLMKGDIDQFTAIYDCEHFSMLSNLPLGVLQSMFVVLQSYYPEMLGRVFLVNFSSTVHTAYKIVSPFLDTFTKSKIVFVEGTGEETLRAEIENRHLPKWLGGTSDFKFE